MLAFIREPLARPPVKNEAAESCPESITTTGRTNFLGFAVSSAKKEGPGKIIIETGNIETSNKIEQNFYAAQSVHHSKLSEQIADMLHIVSAYLNHQMTDSHLALRKKCIKSVCLVFMT